MAILNQKRILNLIPKVSAPVTIHVSQGDVGTQIEFTLVKGDEVFSNTGNLTASVHGVREDGANFGPFTCNLSGSKVTFPLHSEMTAVKGSALAEIVLVDNVGNKVGSANFGILVEESVFPLGVTYDNDVSVYESILAYVQTIPARVQNDISLINTRIDEIIAPSGEAPNPSEIIDARIGNNGTVYQNLGTAIRTQIDDTHTSFKSIGTPSYDLADKKWETGYIGANGAIERPSDLKDIIIAFPIKVSVGDVVRCNPNYGFRVAKYSTPQMSYITTEGVFIERSELIKSGYYEIDEDCYIRICLQTSPATAFDSEQKILEASKNIFLTTNSVKDYRESDKYIEDEIRTDNETVEDLTGDDIEWTLGLSFDWSTGRVTELSENIRMRSPRIYVKKGTRISVSDKSLYKFGVGMYTDYSMIAANYYKYGKYINDLTIDEFVVPMDCYVYITMAKIDESILSDDSIKSQLYIKLYKPLLEEVFLPTEFSNYYVTNGQTFSQGENIVISASTLFKSRIIDCEEGDRFFITGVGGSSGRIWAFVDNSGNILSAESANVQRRAKEIIAPIGAKYLVVNIQSNAEQQLIAKLEKVVTAKSIINENKNSAYIEQRIPVNTVKASFTGTTTNAPKLNYEASCRTFMFYMEKGKTYNIKLAKNSSAMIGFMFDKVPYVPIDAFGTKIDLNGFYRFDSNEYTFNNTEFQTCYVYASYNTVEYDAEIVVTEVNSDKTWKELTANDSYMNCKTIRFPSLIGSPKIYYSEPTASEETLLNAKTISELYSFYDDLCLRFPKMIKRVSDIGMDASNTYEIREYVMTFANPLVTNGEVTLSGDIDFDNITNLWKDSYANNIFAITSGMHGNEKAPTWGLALSIEEILTSDEDFANFIKSNFEIHIIPCINPWGFQNNIRRNSNDVDINRDFYDYTQSETQAYRDWIEGIKERCVALLDVHGTTGYYAYYETGDETPNYEGLCRLAMRFTTMIQNNWKQFYADHNLNKYPYCFMCRSTYAGTYRSLLTKLGLLACTVETPQNFTHGNTNIWDSDLQSCKLTKDLVINTMQMLGEWGYRIKNYEDFH